MITHIKDPKSDKCIVFIHGLGGSPKTFLKFNNYLGKKFGSNILYKSLLFTFYRKLVNKEVPKYINKLTFYIFPILVYIFKIGWSKRNTHNSKLLQIYIDNNCSEYKEIYLVGHSMGGLIARQYLVNCKKENIDIRKIRMLCTYATPHNGAWLARQVSKILHLPILKNGYRFFSKKTDYRIFSQIGDLSNLNEFILNLNEEWRDLNIEQNLKFVRIGGAKDCLVSLKSSSLHNDDINNVFYYPFGHSGIISPSEKDNEFAPIDKFLEKLALLEDIEEYNEELEEEINYDDNYNLDDF